MRHALALAVAVTLMVAQAPSFGAQVAGTGVITGTLSGPNGVLAGVTVQALDATGTLIGATVSAETGVFMLSGLSAGTFTVQAVGANGAVIGASSVSLTAGAMTATAVINATAGALAASAATAVTGVAAAGATGGVISSGAVLAAVGATAIAVGTAAVIVTNEDASGSQ